MEDAAALKTLAIPSGDALEYCGPPPEAGSLPALFYFALSSGDSLGSDPYNQVIMPLRGLAMRCFSVTLPFHDGTIPYQEAVILWAKGLSDGSFDIEAFFSKTLAILHYVVQQGLADPEKIAVAGLSRGGFIAAHLAAREPLFKRLLAFAPLTSFSHIDEFAGAVPDALKAYDLSLLAPKLANKAVRLYIGNRDVRVGTEQCYRFFQQVTEAAYQSGIRTAPLEMIITPSIGHRGHGTSKEIFESGAEWIKREFSLAG